MSGLGDSFLRGLSFAGASEADPVAWAAERGEHLWSRQAEIARSVAAERYTAVPSAHGVGKSHTAAVLALWWTATHPPAETFVVTSAPTANQVNAILWRYIARLHAKHGLPGQVTGWKSLMTNPTLVIGDNLVGSGRKPAELADKDQAMQAFQGIHARYLLVLLDEATGVPGWLWDAADTLMTAREARMLAIGNPDSPSSRFAEVCKAGSGWNVVPISAYDSPAFTGEEVPAALLEELVGPTWVAEREKRWGRESSLFTSKVLGRFPEEDDSTLISQSLIRAAMDRESDIDEDGTPGTLGVDVAGDGPASDETVIYRVCGPRVRRLYASRVHDTMTTVGEVIRRRRTLPSDRVVVDSIGIGRGVHDRLDEQYVPVVKFPAGGAARDSKQFENLRAEAYWKLRERFMRGEVDLEPEDEDLAAQLGEIRFLTNSRGRTQIESKDSMKKRGVASPDRADAVAMAFWRESIGGDRGAVHHEHAQPIVLTEAWLAGDLDEVMAEVERRQERARRRVGGRPAGLSLPASRQLDGLPPAARRSLGLTRRTTSTRPPM